MATRTWNGSNGSFTDAGSWSPAGAPTAGDTAVINSGTVSAAGTISGVNVELNEATGATTSTTLALNAATLDSGSTLSIYNQQGFTTLPSPIISVAGTSTFAGTASVYGSRTTFSIASGATLVNTGTMNFYSSSPAATGGTFQNSGTLAFLNPTNGVQVPDFTSAITGTGTIALGEHAHLELDGSVGSGQTIVFNDGSSGNETLQLNNAGAVSATIQGFSASDNLLINTAASYTGFSYSGSTLTLNGIGSLNIVGPYTQGNFSVQSQAVGNGTTNILVTTNVNNPVSAGLPAGYQNGGNGLAVYRFFDNVFGTHLFTQSQSEALGLVTPGTSTYRPDLTQETNNFGSVNSTAPGAEPVYRFFETTNGTHFYTASQAEFNALTTPGSGDYRPDLTPEPTSTIYEDSTQQAGDVAVYRLFDTAHGTQFLTGSQTEYAGLTTAGSSTYRPDLTPEGVAFYAPAGTFHT